jgi:hypothetical protein
MHPRQSGDLGQVREADAAVEICADIVLHAPKPPFGKCIDPGPSQLPPGDVRGQRLADTEREEVVFGIPASEQDLRKLFGKRIAQQNEIACVVCAEFGLSRRLMGLEVVRGDVEVEKVERVRENAR